MRLLPLGAPTNATAPRDRTWTSRLDFGRMSSPGAIRGTDGAARVATMPMLLVLTGPSHGGKTSAARSLLSALNGEPAHVSIDEIVAGIGLSDWEKRLPDAYAIALEKTREL